MSKRPSSTGRPNSTDRPSSSNLAGQKRSAQGARASQTNLRTSQTNQEAPSTADSAPEAPPAPPPIPHHKRVMMEKMKAAGKRALEAFLVFEVKEGTGLVEDREIPAILRSLGLNPTPSQCEAVVQEMKAGSETSLIGLDQYEPVIIKILCEREKDYMRDSYHTILRAFRAFDPEDKGFFEPQELRDIMSQDPDAFSEQELDEMIAAAIDEKSGKIFYEEYAYKLSMDGRAL